LDEEGSDLGEQILENPLFARVGSNFKRGIRSFRSWWASDFCSES